MAWIDYVLLGIGIAINIAGFIYNVWLMTHSASRANAWQEGFDEGLKQGEMVERSKNRVWADEEKEQAVEDLLNCMYYANPKNNNTCNFCVHDCERERCKGKDDRTKCRPCWRGVRKEKDDE